VAERVIGRARELEVRANTARAGGIAGIEQHGAKFPLQAFEAGSALPAQRLG
jgi:hypothetical protein